MYTIKIYANGNARNGTTEAAYSNCKITYYGAEGLLCFRDKDEKEHRVFGFMWHVIEE